MSRFYRLLLSAAIPNKTTMGIASLNPSCVGKAHA